MKSKLEYLKKYAAKKKKKEKVKEEKVEEIPRFEIEMGDEEDDEKPKIYYEDGVTEAPPKLMNTISQKQLKWTPIDVNENEIKPKIRHDTESEEDEKNEIVWGKVEKVTMERKEIKEIVHEMQKPLARYKDDPDLEKHLKSVVRKDDPMKNMISENDKIVKSKINFQNRFNICPGKRWDGIDRSNGFERKRYERIQQVSNQEQEAFMFFAEDI